MLKLRENNRLFGAGHLVLNVFRAFNIVGLLAVAVASWVMIVLSGLTGNFFFFEAASHFFTSCAAAFLICSELNLFKRYFATRWPVLSPSHGLAWLGVAMVVMGCHVLGNLNRRSVTADNMGPHFWRLVLASGILAITFGFFNVAASMIFRDGERGITARHVRSDGAIATAASAPPVFGWSSKGSSSFAESYSTRADSVREEKRFRRITQKFVPWAAGGKPKISKPVMVTTTDDGGESGVDGVDRAAAAAAAATGNNSSRDGENGGISLTDNPYPDDNRCSPIMPDVERPPTALHPIHNRYRFTGYSEASHLNRF